MVTELCLALDPPVPRTVGATFSSGFGAGNGRVRSTRADSPAKPTSEVHSMRPAKSTFTEIPPCWSGISVMRLVKKKLQPPPPPPGPGSGNGSSIGSRLPIALSASGGVLTGSSEVTSAGAGVATAWSTRLVLSRHCWLVPPLQSHCWIAAPFSIDAPATSRHLPEWTALRVTVSPTSGGELSSHCWLVPPWQPYCWTCTPLSQDPPGTSMHLEEWTALRVTASASIARAGAAGATTINAVAVNVDTAMARPRLAAEPPRGRPRDDLTKLVLPSAARGGRPRHGPGNAAVTSDVVVRMPRAVGREPT